MGGKNINCQDLREFFSNRELIPLGIVSRKGGKAERRKGGKGQRRKGAKNGQGRETFYVGTRASSDGLTSKAVSLLGMRLLPRFCKY